MKKKTTLAITAAIILAVLNTLLLFGFLLFNTGILPLQQGKAWLAITPTRC